MTSSALSSTEKTPVAPEARLADFPDLRNLNRTLRAHGSNSRALMRAGSEQEYLDAVCRIIREDCGHAMVWIGYAEMDEGKRIRPVAYAGFEAGYLETLQLTWADTERGRGPTGTAVRTGLPAFCRNMLTDPHFAPWRAEAVKRGYASSMVLPLLADGKAFGAVAIYSREADPFNDAEVALMGDLVKDVAFGIRTLRTREARARAEEAHRRSAERLALLADTAGQLLASADPQPLVESLCRKVMAHLDCQAFFSFLVDPVAGKLRLNACAGIPPEEARRIEWLDYGVAVCGCAARDGHRIVAERIPTTPDPRTELVKSYGIKAYACHPLLGAGGQVLGTLSFGTRTRETFSDDDLSLMKAVTDHVAVAMARLRADQALRQLNETLEERVARRTEEVRRLADRLRALTVELTQTEQRERRRMATVLHDHIQQLLVAARMQMGAAQDFAQSQAHRSALVEVDRYLEEALTASRNLTVELSPPVLHDMGLSAGLHWLAQQVLDRYQLNVEVRSDNQAEPKNETVRLFLFHAARELLFNTVKHASATWAQMTLTRDGGGIRLQIRDNGKGFDPAAIEARPAAGGGFGLFSLRERLNHLGGSVEIHSAPGEGALIVLHAPIELAGQAQHEPIGPRESRAAAVQSAAASRPNESRRIRVVLADDHRIVRQGLASVLMFESDIEVVGEADNGEKAIELARALAPDVIVMDVTMPRVDGVEATRIIRQENPRVQVVGLSMHEEGDVAEAMRRAGACAYLSKGGPSRELVAAIRRAVGPTSGTGADPRTM